MRTTKESRELIRAFGAVACRWIKTGMDGKRTRWETLGFLGDVPEVYDGVKGIGEVPAELADLDPNEKVILIGDIKQEMIACGISHRDTDAAEWILDWAYNEVRNFFALAAKIKERPPSALPV